MVQKYKGGEAKIIRFDYSDRSWTRWHEWTAYDDPGHKIYEWVHVIDNKDDSRMYAWDDYDPNCSCCYLGFAHSQRKHDISKSTAKERV